ncbi:MAG: ISKra4 family transposase [Acidobacteria bacterium]|nr:ISKra4 family transposase [Acidobacteriota bacterium]
MALRAALHQAGAAALSHLLRFAEPAVGQRTLPCSCGRQARYRELRAKTVLTVLGAATIARPYYLCPHCQQGQFPADRELDVADTEFSPGVRRMQALVGQDAPFDRGREQMHMLAGLEVTTKSVERVAEAIGADIALCEDEQAARAVQLELPIIIGPPVPVLYIELDGTGVPVVKKETVNRKGKADGQPAHTREAKLGCVFTQTKWDEDGFAIRDPDSTTYTGAIETAQEFGKRLYVEAWKRGWSRAEKKVVIGDGAEWIWNIAQQYFPGAIQIVDIFHARQHLWNLARLLHPGNTKRQNQWIGLHQKRWLDDGKIDKLAASLRALPVTDPELAKKVRTEADYFANNAARMDYPLFRSQHLFIGSGVVEAGCKTVIGHRLKQSGMFWTVNGANSILALRCCRLNRRFEDYWENRRAA